MPKVQSHKSYVASIKYNDNKIKILDPYGNLHAVESEGSLLYNFMSSPKNLLSFDGVDGELLKMIYDNKSLLDFSTTFPIYFYKDANFLDLESSYGEKRWLLSSYNIVTCEKNFVYDIVIQFTAMYYLTNYKGEAFGSIAPHKIDYYFYGLYHDTSQEINEEDKEKQHDILLAYNSGDIMEDILGDLDWDLDNTEEIVAKNTAEVEAEFDQLLNKFADVVLSGVSEMIANGANKMSNNIRNFLFLNSINILENIIDEQKKYRFFLGSNQAFEQQKIWFTDYSYFNQNKDKKEFTTYYGPYQAIIRVP
ncbi:MAG: hypothetical protein QXF12_00485 [Candidatus Aenigmatarchaeota archaeon]